MPNLVCEIWVRLTIEMDFGWRQKKIITICGFKTSACVSTGITITLTTWNKGITTGGNRHGVSSAVPAECTLLRYSKARLQPFINVAFSTQTLSFRTPRSAPHFTAHLVSNQHRAHHSQHRKKVC
jgi:hypothetical protein